jgi:cellobiose-specific phosphotransferase system component IIC
LILFICYNLSRLIKLTETKINMANKQPKNNSKYLSGFWPIFIIVVVSMVAGGIIYAFAYGNMQQDEIDSISFWHPLVTAKTSETQKAPTKKILPKPVVKQ